jgi:hypothetical protein
VFRVDFETSHWIKIFSVTPYLSAAEKLGITVSLFRLRTLHVGVWDSVAGGEGDDDVGRQSQDRCTILLEWLLQLISAAGQSFSGTLWTYLADNIEIVLFLVKDLSIFADFICAFYHSLLASQAVSFRVKETTVGYDAKIHMPQHTVNTILLSLAICKCKFLSQEAADFCDYALCAAFEGISLPSSWQPTERFVPASDESGPKAVISFQYVSEMNDATRWWRLVCVLAHCLNLDISSFTTQLGMTLIPLTTESFGGSEPLPSGADTAIRLKGDVVLQDRIRWINLVAPAVMCYEDANAHPLLLAILNSFTGMTTGLAKAIIRNTKLYSYLLENEVVTTSSQLMSNGLLPPPARTQRMLSATMRHSLLQHSVGLCSNSNILSQLRKSFGPNAPTGISRALDRLELNCVWVDYVKQHFQKFLAEKRREGHWSSGDYGTLTAAQTDGSLDDPKQISI